MPVSNAGVFSFVGVLYFNDMEARATEYMGVVYKSKTEAMFALIKRESYKELGRRFRLKYENKKYKTPDGYIPDFVTDEIDEPFLADFTTLIEVKPKRPTMAYINYLEKQFTWLKEKDWFESISFYILFVCNPYDRTFEYIMFDTELCKFIIEYETPLWFKEEWFDLALNYRFDLEGGF